MSARRLRAVPDLLTEEHVPAGALTPEHEGRTVSVVDRRGGVLGILQSFAPTLTPGRTVLEIATVGTVVQVGLRDETPVRVYPPGKRFRFAEGDQ